jgi:hypothetical protein
MSVPLGLLNGFVSKKFSHGEEVYPIMDGMASEAMAERMKGNPTAGQLSLADKGDDRRGSRRPTRFLFSSAALAATRRASGTPRRGDC